MPLTPTAISTSASPARPGLSPRSCSHSQASKSSWPAGNKLSSFGAYWSRPADPGFRSRRHQPCRRLALPGQRAEHALTCPADLRLALGAVGDPGAGGLPGIGEGTVGRCSRLGARLCVSWRCRRCPRSRAAMTCLLRSSTTPLSAPPMAPILPPGPHILCRQPRLTRRSYRTVPASAKRGDRPDGT